MSYSILELSRTKGALGLRESLGTKGSVRPPMHLVIPMATIRCLLVQYFMWELTLTDHPPFLTPHYLHVLHSSISKWKELACYTQRSFLHILILQTLEVMPEDFEGLTPYSPYKEKAYIYKILVSSISPYKLQAPSYPRYLALHFYSYWRSLSHWLNLWRVFG